MKRENSPASRFVHFSNATVLRTAIVAVVEIPGAYPGVPSRRRVVTTGSFPIDVTESLEEVLARWEGDPESEDTRRRGLETRLATLEKRQQEIRTLLAGFTPPTSLDGADLLSRADRIKVLLEEK